MEYRFSPAPDLSRMDARVCFRGPPPAALICGTEWGRRHLISATDSAGRELPIEGHRIRLASLPPGSCLDYSVDLASVSGGFHQALRARRFGEGMTSNVALWLWRPPLRSLVSGVTARFELPEGMQVSVPWPRRGDGYVLDRTAFAYLAYSAFGRFDHERIEVPGAVLEVAIMKGLPARTRAHVRPWLETAGRAVAMVGGRFPRSRAQVVVIPGGPSRSPVGFGTVSRGGGASVAIFLRDNAELDPLRRDWTAIHEFSHLFHPFVEREDAWLSEGLATYYQEVSRVRAGLLGAEDSWRRIHAGALKRSGASGTLAEESAMMFSTFRFPMVYWAGAAFALMADVELRKRSRGEMSLDRVMMELSACCSAAPRPWPASRVLARMDEIADMPVFSELAQRHVLAGELPDLAPLYRELGIEVSAAQLTLDDDAPLASIRRAIMRAQRGGELAQ